jgi:YbbR domain-containing protein
MVPQSRREEFTALHTEPVDLDEITQSATLRAKVTMPELSRMADNAPAAVKVRIEVREIREKGK